MHDHAPPRKLQDLKDTFRGLEACMPPFVSAVMVPEGDRHSFRHVLMLMLISVDFAYTVMNVQVCIRK